MLYKENVGETADGALIMTPSNLPAIKTSHKSKLSGEIFL